MQEAKSYSPRRSGISYCPPMDKVRELIDRTVVERGHTLKSASLAIGRSHSYLQQFIKRGIPRNLPERDRRKLAALLHVLEAELRSDDDDEVVPLDDLPPEFDDLTPRVGAGKRVHIKAGFIPEFDLRAGASYGGGYALQGQVREGDNTYDADVVKAEWGIPPSFLQGELRLHPLRTDVLAVDGPSMIPDLMPGDRVLVDRSHTDPRQGGIFAVREDGGVIIKHVEVVRGSDPPRIVCKSSNPTYAPFELILDGENIAIIGRVAGRISRM
jgi:hypothetical protein